MTRPISPRTAVEIWVRDGGCCVYCRRRLAPDTFTLDHVVPLSKGGSRYAPANMVLSCGPCNRDKADQDPDGFPQVRGLGRKRTGKHRPRAPLREAARMNGEVARFLAHAAGQDCDLEGCSRCDRRRRDPE